MPVEQAMDEFLRDVSTRIKNLEISDVEELRYAACPAHRFSIHWPGKERVILFIEREDALYRLIQDPASPLNKEILQSVEFRRNS